MKTISTDNTQEKSKHRLPPANAKERLQRESLNIFKFLLLGLAYALWVELTGLGIPCPFRLFLHIKCPGCGMTHAARAMIHLDFRSAFYHNKLSLTILPVLLIIFIDYEIRYIKTAERRFRLWEKILLLLSYIAVILYGILRNLPGPVT